MSQVAPIHMKPLAKQSRNKLEQVIKSAREVAEEAATAICGQLGVGLAKPDDHLTEQEKELRRRLRVHGRQLGDRRNAKGEQEIDRLVEEIAYQHWHRMLFARFLAENNLLMYPDPDDPVSVSLDDCEEMAADEGANDGWDLAARFATQMLPQVFRSDSPIFALALPPEKQQELIRLMSDLPQDTFDASDSVGWVYQFWQAKRKDEVNASEVKIGARELPAVTQLFTEPYMVSFLLDNSLGAWWASRRLTPEDLREAGSERELRDKASLATVTLDYLRFVKDEDTGAWTPAAGTFDSWPKSLAELKTLDPCCGSGHFLVAALLMLVPMRMELEGLSAQEAVDRVLSENLHGLEIDQRCVELAAFALAIAAWRYPDAGGYRKLPDLNVACCGLSVGAAKEEWKELALDKNQLRIALDWMYDEFRNAPVLGSLLNPATSMAARVVKWEELYPLLQTALNQDSTEERREAAVVAHGLARAAILLSQKYDWVITNVPYLGREWHTKPIKDLAESKYETAKADLATMFLLRCLEFAKDTGVTSTVVPQYWLFLSRYEKLRKKVLDQFEFRQIAKLGSGAFDTITGEVVNVALATIAASPPNDDTAFSLCDVTKVSGTEEKADHLASSSVTLINQESQTKNPNTVIGLLHDASVELLEKIAYCYQGLATSDNARFLQHFWERAAIDKGWVPYQFAPQQTGLFGGMSHVLYWDNGTGEYYQHCLALKEEKRLGGWKSGHEAWGKRGVAVNRMGDLASVVYLGTHFDCNVAMIIPDDQSNLAAIHSYCTSSEFSRDVRKINQKLSVTNATLAKVPFDLERWQEVASQNHPFGFPEPCSDDPTQWIFHGHPACAENALQVAVARLLGYRWPTELDTEMQLSVDARKWIEACEPLAKLVDDDGIVCLPAVGTEQPAEDRLLNLLHKAYETGRAVELSFQAKLEDGDAEDKLTRALLQRNWKPSLPGSFNDWMSELLEEVGYKGKSLKLWLRDAFFTQHIRLFQNHPFIWHVWDGLKDGFSVLVNYHKLDNKLLSSLIYSYLNDWISRQKRDRDAQVDGSQEKLAAAESLKRSLELILHGDAPYDIFVRWKPIEAQPVGWNPDCNDGIRINIRPWMTVADVNKKGAGILRDKPNLKWTKDRGKDVATAPWHDIGPEHGEKVATRINDHHLSLADKKRAIEEAAE